MLNVVLLAGLSHHFVDFSRRQLADNRPCHIAQITYLIAFERGKAPEQFSVQKKPDFSF
ncbi:MULTISPECIES: hypothetical protein [Pseudomonas]|uniref:hypothetical protein n=1 Tax=Pseudomonas TaxID=286 RepID=UPI001E2AEC94|nr:MULTISPECIES: hypothetical protein [Pseudomonas]